VLWYCNEKIFATVNIICNKWIEGTKVGSGTKPTSCTMGTESLHRGYSCRGMTLTTHTNLASRLNNENSYTSTPTLGIHGMWTLQHVILLAPRILRWFLDFGKLMYLHTNFLPKILYRHTHMNNWQFFSSKYTCYV